MGARGVSAVMKPIAEVLFVAALLVACGERSSGGAADSGIRGVVLSGPQCPVETLESPCPDLPVAGIVVRVTASDGSVAAEPVTDAEGRFETPVSAGEYVVLPVAETGGATSAKPQNVTVVEGEFAEVSLLVDTGIR